MKIQTHNQNGSVLMVILLTTMILGFSLASYLHLVRNQNLSIMRSQQWNMSIPVLEAGIEEAMTHLYKNAMNDLATDGWTLADGLYHKKRQLGENMYAVSIQPGTRPIILSKGYVRVPLKNQYIEPPRTVQVVVTNVPLFRKGMVAKGNIDLNGNNITSNSFDSEDPAYSTNGRYDPAKTNDNGDIATNSSFLDSLNVWNAKLYGRASTGPGGLVRVGANGVIGSKDWHAAGKTGIEPGWVTDDMNVLFPDVHPPFSGGALTPIAGVVNLVSHKHILTSGNWQLSELSLSGQESMLVMGDAVLYVTGNVSMTGNSVIEIPAGSSLKLYVGGTSANFAGNGIANAGGNAMDFFYYGLNSNTDLKLAGNNSFTGAIYAPYAHFHLGGGGNDDYDFVGASVTASVKMNGKYNFHYDENLGRNGPRSIFTIESWNEL
jgi:hypothetical protein